MQHNKKLNEWFKLEISLGTLYTLFQLSLIRD